MRAVLLAAGKGERLRPYFKRPKPLVSLLGRSLIERNILTLKECGIKEIIVVLGAYANEIRQSLGSGEKLGVKIKYLENPDWHLGNGVSAHTFHQECRPDEKFILMMVDHIFPLEVLKQFTAEADSLKPDEILLAADKRLDEVHDVEECTKVKAEGNLALKLGKQLTDFNAVDCGLFMGTEALLHSLAQAINEGNYALTDAVNLLAAQGKVRLHFVDGFWIDVDDLASYQACERFLLKSLVPPKDGLVSRTINRKFSLRITKLLASTNITPNQITIGSFLITLSAAISFATGHPFLAGLLAQLSSIVDGVDGEIARLKFLKSNFGGILDAILDRYGDALLVIGMTYSWYATSQSPTALIVGAIALVGTPMSMLFKEKFQALTGQTFVPEVHDGPTRYLPVNRDGRLLIIMLGGIFNQIPATLIFLAVITHLQTMFRLYNAWRLVA
mgnify:CR=1 FL=1